MTYHEQRAVLPAGGKFQSLVSSRKKNFVPQNFLVFKIEWGRGAPLFSVYGGKIFLKNLKGDWEQILF